MLKIIYPILYNAVPINDCIYEVNKNTYAIRGNKKVIPQITRLVNALNIDNAYGICNKLGSNGLYKCLKD
ncbi:MAG: DUF1152 domain-containing protein, partial [Saccharolobus sp.]